MAASHPPYHLRTNKAVDRLLFVDQIARVRPPGISTGSYHSLGGPFMEDLRLVHRRFPHMRLVCIESDKQTHKRQQAHRFTRHLETHHRTFAQFLTHQYEPEPGDVFWLDFTEFNLRCISDFQELLRQIPEQSLVRITVRCEPPINERVLVGHVEPEKVEKLKLDAYKKLKGEIDKFIPPEWTEVDPVGYGEYAVFVQQILRLSISDVLDKANDREFLHIDSMRYEDGTWMLSLTGLICLRSNIRNEVSRLKAAKILPDPGWQRVPGLINVPHLSMQERIALDQKLPVSQAATGKMLQRRLGYWVGNSEKNSEEALRQYAKYYQEYPSFVRQAY